jgi:hypothetical protein
MFHVDVHRLYYQALIQGVEALEKKQPRASREHPKTKLLKRTLDLILVEIPYDLTARNFRLAARSARLTVTGVAPIFLAGFGYSSASAAPTK